MNCRDRWHKASREFKETYFVMYSILECFMCRNCTNVHQGSGSKEAEESYAFIPSLETTTIQDIARRVVPQQLASSMMIENLESQCQDKSDEEELNLNCKGENMADNGEDGKEHDAEDETNSDDETGETEDGGQGRIDIEYIQLQLGWLDNVSSKSDHSFRLRQDTAGNSKNKYKLSLNRIESLAGGLTPEAAKSSSPSRELSQTCVPDKDQHSSGSSSFSAHPSSPNKTQSPSLKKVSSAVEPQLSLHSAPSLTRKRPMSGITSCFPKKSKMSTDLSGERPLTVESTTPCTSTDPSR
ncbi:hypothetical protein ACROYT_G015228 [Oculina patagonica]